MKERCICAAIVCRDETIIRGHRHSDCIHTAIISNKLPKGRGWQGFITSKNRYVGREEGAKLQQEAGIDSIYTGNPVDGVLFSEDLY